MAKYNIRAKWFGWAGLGGGGASSAAVGGVIVSTVYDKPLRPAPLASQFTATVAGVARGVVSAVVGAPNNQKLTFTLAAGNLTAGQVVVITYAPGAVAATRLAYADGSGELAAGTLSITAA